MVRHAAHRIHLAVWTTGILLHLMTIKARGATALQAGPLMVDLISWAGPPIHRLWRGDGGAESPTTRRRGQPSVAGVAPARQSGNNDIALLILSL